MKKKLFAVAIVVSLYVLVMLDFTAADEKGKVSRVLSEIGLSESVALAATQIVSATDGGTQPSFYGPMKKRKSKRKNGRLKRGK